MGTNNEKSSLIITNMVILLLSVKFYIHTSM